MQNHFQSLLTYYNVSPSWNLPMATTQSPLVPAHTSVIHFPPSFGPKLPGSSLLTFCLVAYHSLSLLGSAARGKKSTTKATTKLHTAARSDTCSETSSDVQLLEAGEASEFVSMRRRGRRVLKRQRRFAVLFEQEDRPRDILNKTFQINEAFSTDALEKHSHSNTLMHKNTIGKFSKQSFCQNDLVNACYASWVITN